MKLARIASLAGFAALTAWSVAACSSDETTNNGDGGTGGEEGDASKGTGGHATGGSAGNAGKGNGGSNGGAAGKGGNGGANGGAAGKAGGAGKGGAAGSAGDGGTETNDGGDPSVKITDPKTGETISKDAEYTMFPKIPIAFKVGNFTLKAPGSSNCPTGTCGHVHINVDGNDCNVNANTAYNNAGAASPLDIDLALCKGGIAGAHTVTITLHNNDHTNVSLTDGGPAISDEIVITAVEGDGGKADGG